MVWGERKVSILTDAALQVSYRLRGEKLVYRDSVSADATESFVSDQTWAYVDETVFSEFHTETLLSALYDELSAGSSGEYLSGEAACVDLERAEAGEDMSRTLEVATRGNSLEYTLNVSYTRPTEDLGAVRNDHVLELRGILPVTESGLEQYLAEHGIEVGDDPVRTDGSGGKHRYYRGYAADALRQAVGMDADADGENDVDFRENFSVADADALLQGVGKVSRDLYMSHWDPEIVIDQKDEDSGTVDAEQARAEFQEFSQRYTVDKLRLTREETYNRYTIKAVFKDTSGERDMRLPCIDFVLLDARDYIEQYIEDELDESD